jgi:hypothetical protein
MLNHRRGGVRIADHRFSDFPLPTKQSGQTNIVWDGMLDAS